MDKETFFLASSCGDAQHIAALKLCLAIVQRAEADAKGIFVWLPAAQRADKARVMQEAGEWLAWLRRN